MSIGGCARPPRCRSRKSRRRRGQQPSLADFAAAYTMALAVSIAAKVLVFNGSIHLFWLVAIHLACGYALNRYILNSLEWNPNFTSLAVLAKIKLLALVGWPIAYGVLLLQLWVVRYL